MIEEVIVEEDEEEAAAEAEALRLQAEAAAAAPAGEVSPSLLRRSKSTPLALDDAADAHPQLAARRVLARDADMADMRGGGGAEQHPEGALLLGTRRRPSLARLQPRQYFQAASSTYSLNQYNFITSAGPWARRRCPPAPLFKRSVGVFAGVRGRRSPASTSTE